MALLYHRRDNDLEHIFPYLDQLWPHCQDYDPMEKIDASYIWKAHSGVPKQPGMGSLGFSGGHSTALTEGPKKETRKMTHTMTACGQSMTF